MADRVRRVSFLVDLGAGTAEERAQVRLVLSRVLTHLSRQSPAPPRWSFRFYDSSLTPQRFDARMHARAKAPSAVDPKLGAAASLRRDEFHACTPDAIAAVLRQYDQAVELYNAADAEGANHVGTPPEHPGDPVDGPDSAERTGWFTTLARQMAGVIQRAAGELAGMTGDGDGGGSERQHSAVVILARVRGDAPAPSNDENDPTAQPPPTGTEVDFLRPFKGIEDAYRKENTRAYLLRLGTSPSSRETLRRASELFARFGGSSAPVAAVAHTCSCLPPGLLMSAFARVKPHRGGHGTTPDGNDGNDRPLGSFVLSARRHATELWVRRTNSQTTSEKKSESSSDSSSVRLGAIAVLPCDEPGYHGRSIRGIRRVTIASLASADQLAACWVRTGGRRMGKIPGKRDGVGGAFGGGVGTSIAVAAKGSAAYALGALLAIRRAGAIVELEMEWDREEESDAAAADDRIEEEEEEEEALATQETDATTAAGGGAGVVVVGGGGRRGVRNARSGSVHLAALLPLSPGTMSLVAVEYPDAPNTPGRDDVASDVASDVEYDADVDALTSALAAACGDDGWGALEPFFPDLSAEDAARGASASASELGNLARIIASSTGDDADGSGGEATNRAGRDAARGDLAAALAAAARAAPAGTHRWERWYGGGPERKSFGDSLAASIAGAPNGAGVLSPGPLRLPGVGCDDERAVDGPSESDAALDARFRAMVGDVGVPDENPATPGAAENPNRAAREGRRRSIATAPTRAWVLDDLPAVLARARSEYDALFERYFAGNDADPGNDAPATGRADPDFARLARSLAGDAVGSARAHLPPGGCSDDAVDAVEGELVMSQAQLEARHRAGGCKSAKRREHAFQAHLSLSLHSLRASESDKRRTKKAAKHLAKVVNPLSFLLHPVGIQALHAFVEDELSPRYNDAVPRLMAALRSNLGVGAVVEKTVEGGSRLDSKAGRATRKGECAGGVFSPGIVAGRKTAGGGGGGGGASNPREDEYGGESGESSEAPGGLPRRDSTVAGKPDPGHAGGSFKMPNPKTGVKWHNLFRSRAGPAKREVRMAPVKSAEELRKAQDEEAAARREKEKRALFLREQRQRQQPAQREKLLMVPPGFQPTPDAGNRKVMQMPAPRNLALAAFGAGPGSTPGLTPGRQAAIAAMQTPLPNRNRRESVSMTPGPRGGRLSEIMSTPMAMSTPRAGTRGTALGSRGAAMLQQAMCTPARETVAETPAGSRGMVVAATPLHGRDGGGVGAQRQQVGARKGMLGFGAMVREAREAEEEQAPSKRAKKMFTFGGRAD